MLSTSPRITIIWPAGTSLPPAYADRRWVGTPLIATSPRRACVKREISLLRCPVESAVGGEDVITKFLSKSTTRACIYFSVLPDNENNIDTYITWSREKASAFGSES